MMQAQVGNDTIVIVHASCLQPYDEKGATVRIRVSVPKMNVGATSGTALALVIHELATNSAKYGALSLSSGTLDVSCNAHDEDEVLVMWTERGGPPVVAPRRLWKQVGAPKYGRPAWRHFSSLTGPTRG